VDVLHGSVCKDLVHRLVFSKGNEAKAAGPLVVVVVHDHCILHCTKLLKVLAQDLQQSQGTAAAAAQAQATRRAQMVTRQF
jgi:hypothetical protein